MGKAVTEGGLGLPTHLFQQQSGGGASGGMQRVALVGVISLLFTVNLLYFVKTHTTIDMLTAGTAMQHQHQLRNIGSIAAGQGAAAAVPCDSQQAAATASSSPEFQSEAAQMTSVDYLTEHVLTSMPPRHPLGDVLLPDLSATNATVKEYRSKVAAYISSDAFKQRWDALKAQTTHQRGIVISAGGKYYLPQAVVLLRVLRHHLNCSLPVEIFWQGDDEMDDATLKALQAEFAPLEGYNAAKLPYPSHHLPGAELKGFPMKPFALLNSRFQQALMLDADVVLMRDPSYMFDAPGFREAGNYHWDDIYGDGMFQDKAYEYIGLDKRVKEELNAGRGDFNRYAESGQVLVNRAMHLDVLEWTWFVNSFSKGHMYEFMYGDKDTYSLGFALAGKAHMYQHINMPPAGIFTHRDALGWQPGVQQMNKQGNWWLHALGQYDHTGELLLMHRVTGEISLSRGTPKDELMTPPIPHSWSMWYMGYGPGDKLQVSLNVVALNVTYFQQTASPGQLCPLAAWSAYWTLRTHGIPTQRNVTLEAACSAVLDAQYGPAAASIIRSRLIEHPVRLVINKLWDGKVDGGWNAPKAPLLAVPFNMTAAYSMWTNMNASVHWAQQWAQGKPTLAKLRRHLMQL